MLRTCIFFLALLGTNILFGKSRVAFITGGASGIGAATVKEFIQHNIKVGFLDIDRVKGRELASCFNPEEVLFIEGDVSKVADIRSAIEQTVEAFGPLNIIFANAGVYNTKNVLEVTEEAWQHVVDTNLKGVVFTVKEGLPYLIQNGGGSIILMASDQCFIGKHNSCLYGMTKGAIGQFTKSTALDFGVKNIRVNAVCPATIRTPLAEKVFSFYADASQTDVEDLWKAEADKYLLKKYGSSEDVAHLVYFLSSDDAAFITGSLYLIDGGLTIY
ncbi:MAG TPA: SDR family oxidoreductase [Rhabdochlamydiaceae bacterium]|jgi:NAD(P)-dependent dehydrogenase (short-subunit alcohol dehydrogenase family)